MAKRERPRATAESVHPHQPAWFWVGSAAFVFATAFATGYGTRDKDAFDWAAQAMILAYVLAFLALVCLAGAIRGWNFPFARLAPPTTTPVEPEVASSPPVSRREAAEPNFRVSVVAHQLMPDGRKKRTQSGPYLSGEPTGDLPLRIDMGDVTGKIHPTADGEEWVWTVQDVAVVNDGLVPIRCRVHLLSGIDENNDHRRDLLRRPNEMVSIESGGTIEGTWEFPLDWSAASSQAGDPLELSLLEVGTQRALRVPLSPAGRALNSGGD